MRATVLLLPFVFGCHRHVHDATDDVVGDDASVDDSDSDTDVAPPAWTDVRIDPGNLTVTTGAVVTYRLRATSPDGVRGSPGDVVWSTDDEDVATIADGVLVAGDEGRTVVHAEWPGGQADANLIVQEDDGIEVTVGDLVTDQPLEGATVQVGAHVLGTTPVDGLLAATGVSADPATICVTKSGYVPQCVLGVVGRRVTLWLRPEDATERSLVHGDVDLWGVGTPIGKVGVAVVLPAFYPSPWLVGAEDLVGERATVNVDGTDVALPSNVAVQHASEQWSLTSFATGPAYAVSAFVAEDEVAQLGDPTVDPFRFVADHLDDDAQWGVGDVYDDHVDVAAGGALDEVVAVETGPLPDGADGDETPVLLGLDYVFLVGLGYGLGSADVASADSVDHVLGIVQAGGPGSGRGMSMAVGEVEKAKATLPAWLPIPSLPTVDLAKEAVTFDVSPDAQIVYARVVDRDGSRLDLWAPGGEGTYDLPRLPDALDLSVSDWHVSVLALDAGCYECVLVNGGARYPDGECQLADGATGGATVAGKVYGE